VRACASQMSVSIDDIDHIADSLVDDKPTGGSFPTVRRADIRRISAGGDDPQMVFRTTAARPKSAVPTMTSRAASNRC
jgi:hypothetical protein